MRMTEAGREGASEREEEELGFYCAKRKKNEKGMKSLLRCRFFRLCVEFVNLDLDQQKKKKKKEKKRKK